MASSADYVVLGGEFTAVNGVPQQGLARFTLPGGSPVRGGPVDGSPGTAPTVYPGATPGTAVVQFPANWDRDEMNLAYEVLRDGRVVGTVRAASVFWNRPMLQVVDTGLSPNIEYDYQIRATHRLNPRTSPVTTFRYPSSQSYASRIAALGPSHQWRLGSPTGSATDPDQAGSAPLTINGAATLGASGALRTDSNTAMTASPGSAPDASTAAAEPATSAVSVELWLKAWVPAGSVAAFGTTPGTNSAPRARELYINNIGQLTAAIRRDGRGPLLVQSGRSIADNKWHHVVFVQSPNSVILYVDGLQVASNSAPTVTGSGRWWLGGRAPSGLAGSVDRGLGAKIDEVTVFGRALSPTEVHQHYSWGLQ